MIDQLRKQIRERLDELGHEMERLRNALTALEPGKASGATSSDGKRSPSATPTPAPAAAGQARPARRRAAASTTRRSAPGSTKAAILAALADGQAMTAGDVAAKTGLGRATVSTTLSKLASSGEVQKAARGYQLAAAS